MGRKEDLKRRVVLWLHRWLVKLQLLKDPWRDRHGIDSPPIFDFEQITIQDVSHLSVSQPGPVTVKDPVHITKDHSQQILIEKPKQIIIGDDPEIVINHPATVTVHVQELVLVENPNEQPHIPLSIKDINGSGPFAVPYSKRVIVTDAERITFNYSPYG